MQATRIQFPRDRQNAWITAELKHVDVQFDFGDVQSSSDKSFCMILDITMLVTFGLATEPT